MSRVIRSFGLLPVLALALALTGPRLLVAPADAQGSCIAEREPNNLPENATSLTGDVCLEGTVPDETDQDLYLWEVSPADSLRTWTFTVTGTLNSQTSVHVIGIDSEPGASQFHTSGEVLRVDSPLDASSPGTRTGVSLLAGRYLLGISRGRLLGDPPASFNYQVKIEVGDPLPPSGDVEPNDDDAAATPVAGAISLSGDLEGSEDHFAWMVPDASQSWQIRVRALIGAYAYLTLETAEGRQLATLQLDQDGKAALYDLRLEPGSYRIVMEPAANAPLPYVLETVPSDGAGTDPEPNDERDLAVPLETADPGASGRLSQRDDVDLYRLTVDARLAASQLDISLRWDGALDRNVCLYDAEYRTALKCRAGAADSVVMPNLLLPAGEYVLEVSGTPDLSSTYALRVEPTAGAGPNLEAEPNNDTGRASHLEPGVTAEGHTEPGDADYFHIVVAGEPQLWLLSATGTGITRLEWISRDDAPLATADMAPDGSTATLTDMYLIPGDHWFALAAGDGSYTLTLTAIGPRDPGGEVEPNNDATAAEPLQVGERRTGRLPGLADVDVYRFSLAAVEGIAIRLEPPVDGTAGFQLTSGDVQLAEAQGTVAGEPVTYRARLQPGDYALWLRADTPSDAPYALVVDREDPFVADAANPPTQLPVTLELTTQATEVAAYWQAGQRVDGELTVANGSDADLELSVDAVTSHYAWSVELSQDSVHIGSGASVTVPLAIHALPDAWADVPVRISVRVRDAAGAQRTASVEVTPRRDASPVHPEQAWSVPDALLGGLDVASPALGGTPVPSVDPGSEPLLYDGLAITASGFWAIANLPLTLTVDLAGDAPVPVAGIILNPLAGAGVLSDKVHGFDLLLSADGSAYDVVLSGELSPLPIEQAFVLDRPIPARFAQLRITSMHGDAVHYVELGEWKVIATPGFSPVSGPIDIAQPVRGGHIVWGDPQPATSGEAEGILSETPEFDKHYLDPGRPIQLVVGFEDDRAAQVTELQWVDPPGSDADQRFAEVKVAVAADTPIGPWLDLGTWALDRAADGSVSPFTLAEPTWARFVRLTGASPEQAAYREFPATLRVLERATDETYRSILGEWGLGARDGIHELLVPPDLSFQEDVDANDNTMETGTLLAPGEEAHGRVQRLVDVDWYRIAVPDTDNTVTFAIRGPRSGATSTVEVRATLYDAAGNELPMDSKPGPDGAVLYAATVTPGDDLRLKVEKPPFSAVFSYDPSSSMGPYWPFVAEALRAFARDVVPGQEAVLVVPFEQQPLLGGWSDVTYELQNAVAQVAVGDGSSSVETALITAAKALSARDGQKAILVVTDAETSSYAQGGDLWSEFADVGPLVFAVHVAGANFPLVTTHLMQDWATSGGGRYQYAVSHGEMDRAFDRMATWLRRPAPYSLSMATTRQALRPGGLRVTSKSAGGRAAVGKDVAIEIVLDTSGSMLEKIGSRRRIDIAKSVLTKLVTKTLPAGVPVALRIFALQPDSCESRLAVPLGPLDGRSMARTINDLTVIQSINTPIGASLHEVARDLAGVTGPRIVVLVTDGKETCKGDPAQEIRDLVAQGLDVQVNIVGFALDDRKLRKDIARWARLGNGAAFDAKNETELAEGIARALAAPFHVYDRSGGLVASGTVGGNAVRLEQGRYRVEVLTDPVVTFDAVVVGSGEQVELTLGDE